MDIMHLKQLLTRHGITQTDLARILRRDKSVITNLFQGKRQLKAGEAALIASHLGVTVAEVMGITDERAGELAEPPALIPFQHEPSHARNRPDIVKKDGRFYLEVPDGGRYSAKAYALEIKDESMNLAGIIPGDVIISELDRPCKPGQMVVVQLYQGRGAATVVRKYEPPYLVPHSTMPSFRPVSIEKSDVRLVSPVLRLVRAY